MVIDDTRIKPTGQEEDMSKDKAVFCDYQKVLCFGRFWDDIRSDDLHPDYDLVETICDEGDRLGFADWMRSRKFDTDDVIDSGIERFIGDGGTLEVDADEKSLELRHLLEKGAGQVALDKDMLAWLREKKANGFYTVLATDNMTVAIDGIRKRADIDKAFDEVLSSSDPERHCLKSDDPQKFFGAFLEEHGLTFADVVLIDDAIANIEAFEAAGGHGLLWTEDSEPLDASMFLYDVFGITDAAVEEELAERERARAEAARENDSFISGDDGLPVIDEDDFEDAVLAEKPIAVKDGTNMPEDMGQAAEEWLDEEKAPEFDWGDNKSGWQRFKEKVKSWFS